MFTKFPIALIILAIPAMADSGLFHKIANKDTVTLVLPNGECDAKVLSRRLDQLTLRLKTTTDACGAGKSRMVLLRTDVQDVVNNTRGFAREPRVASCAAAAVALLGAPAALAIGAKTGNDPAALLVLLGSGLGGAVLCRQRGSSYTVFTDRIALAEP